jgi:hypothetical protein
MNKIIDGLKKLGEGIIKLPNLKNAIDIDGFINLNLKIKEAQRSIGATREVGMLYTQSLRESSIEVGKYNVKIDELVDAQRLYSDSTGRLNAINKESIIQIVEISKAFGIAKDKLVEFAASSEALGISMSSIYSLTEDTMNMAQSMGLNSTKIIKSQIDFLQKETKFITFKNGLEDLRSMAIFTEKIGGDLSKYSGFIEKGMNLEGAMEMATTFQQMGGEFSKLGDFQEIMYKSQFDPEGLVRDIQEATKGIAMMNPKTGQFEIPPQFRMMLKQLAPQLGMDATEMMNTALGNIRLDTVRMEMPKGLERYQDLIEGLSKIEGGRAVITLKDEITGKNVTKAISELTDRDAKILEGLQKSQGTITERAIQGMANADRAEAVATIMENWASMGVGVRFADSKITDSLTRGFVNTSINTTKLLDEEILNPIVNKIDTTEVSVNLDELFQKLNGNLKSLIEETLTLKNVVSDNNSNVKKTPQSSENKETTPFIQGLTSGTFKLETSQDITLNIDGVKLAEMQFPVFLRIQEEMQNKGAGS